MSEKFNGILPVDIGLYKNELPAQCDDNYILTSIDIASGIGVLEEDEFFVEAGTVAYFTTRVALLDILSAGGKPITTAFATSLSNNYYEEIEAGILRSLDEWQGEEKNLITGSTEDNFKPKQTSISIMITGISNKNELNWLQVNQGDKLFIIGKPLVGEQVLINKDKIINSEVFKNLIRDKSTKNLMPVGSGGAVQRINYILSKTGLKFKSSNSHLEKKSAGPATAVLLISNSGIDYYRDKIDIPITYLGKLI